MPIVEGRYESRISTTFKSAKEAVAEIKNKIEKSRRVRVNSIPMKLLKELTPLLKGKDVKIILPRGEKPTAELKKLGPVAVTKARIYKNYKGMEASTGSVYFSDKIFNIVWNKDKIFEIDVMEYSKCVKCMSNIFDMGWRYSKK